MTYKLILVLESSILQMIQCYTNHAQKTHMYLNDSEIFNTELKKVLNWLVGNKIKLNKTRSMILHQSKNSFKKNIESNVKR